MRSFYFIEFWLRIEGVCFASLKHRQPIWELQSAICRQQNEQRGVCFLLLRAETLFWHAAALFKARGFLFPDVFAYCGPSDFFRASWPHAASISEPFSRRSVYEAPASSRILANAARLPASLRCHERAGTLL